MSLVALIAGEGALPYKIIEELKAEGKKILLLGVRGITPEELESVADRVTWGSFMQVGKARKACLRYRVREVVMAGRILHRNIFSLSLLKMDWLTIRMVLSLKDFRANTICDKMIETFGKKGLSFLKTTDILKRYVPPQGVLTRRKPGRKILEDIDFGRKIAQEMGRLDVGQTVVIKNKSIVAVEAMEGTDRCLQRAGEIAGENCVVVKMAKPGQDMRYDVPVIGLNTLEKLVKIKAAALAVEAGKTLMIDPELISFADRNGIIIVSVSS